MLISACKFLAAFGQLILPKQACEMLPKWLMPAWKLELVEYFWRVKTYTHSIREQISQVQDFQF